MTPARKIAWTSEIQWLSMSSVSILSVVGSIFCQIIGPCLLCVFKWTFAASVQLAIDLFLRQDVPHIPASTTIGSLSAWGMGRCSATKTFSLTNYLQLVNRFLNAREVTPFVHKQFSSIPAAASDILTGG
jgi:hypothetical protein